MESSNYRILVVDDEDDIRLIVGLNLKLLGLEFSEATNGEEAIEMLRMERWDACILDLAMPKVDGFSVLNYLAEQKRLQDLAVVVLSAKGSPATAIQALQLGAHSHLTKPFSPASVAQTILELVEITPEQREARRKELLSRAGTLERLGMPTV